MGHSGQEGRLCLSWIAWRHPLERLDVAPSSDDPLALPLRRAPIDPLLGGPPHEEPSAPGETDQHDESEESEWRRGLAHRRLTAFAWR